MATSLKIVAKAPEAARRVGQAIQQQFILPQMSPNMGRPIPDEAELRELGYRVWEFQLRSTL